MNDTPWLAWAERTLGIHAAGSPPAELTASFVRAAVAVGAVDAHDLLRRVTSGDEAARAAVLDALLNGESYVMRHPDQFGWVRDELTRRPGPLRLWSAGCSTGEEAWSLAITAFEALGSRAVSEVRVLGTDINPRSVERAAAGRYRPWSLRNLDPDLRERWFVRDGPVWRVDDALRRITRFATLDLLSPPGAGWPAGVDLAMCRNVLIYLTPGAAEAAVASVTRVVVPGGAVLFAPVDPVPDVPGLVREGGASGLYRVVGPAPVVRLEAPASPGPQGVPAELDPRRPPAEGPLDGGEAALARAMALQASDRHDLAIVEVRRVLASRPHHPAANTLLACSLARMGDADRAIRAAETALRALSSGPRTPAAEELRFVSERVLELYRRR